MGNTLNTFTLPKADIGQPIYVDVDKLVGDWHEIARLRDDYIVPIGAHNVTVNISDNGRGLGIKRRWTGKILNKILGRFVEVTQETDIVARRVRENGDRYKAYSLNSTVSGDLSILQVRSNMDSEKRYDFVIIGNPYRDFLWILSKDRNVSYLDYADLLNSAMEEFGYDLNRVISSA
jgi:lipocalin